MENIFQKEISAKVTKNLYWKKAVQNAFLLWYVPAKYFYSYNYKNALPRKFYVILLNIFTLISGVFLYRKNKKLVYFFVFLFVGFTIPYMIGHAANIRFKLDFEWIQLIFVALYLVHFKTIIAFKKN
jgi:hypothetical protein